MSKMRKKKMDFLSSETDDDVSDVDPEELQKMLEVCVVFSSIIFGSIIIFHYWIYNSIICTYLNTYLLGVLKFFITVFM